jgi:hypothetical protein
MLPVVSCFSKLLVELPLLFKDMIIPGKFTIEVGVATNLLAFARLIGLLLMLLLLFKTTLLFIVLMDLCVLDDSKSPNADR